MDDRDRHPPASPGTLSVTSGTALYVGALIGPGVLLIPALAARAAGPASVISWGVLLVLSAPLAIMFTALGTRMPTRGGVADYVAAAFGPRAALVTGGWFLTAVLIGAPAVAMIGGFYVANLTGTGTGVAALVGLAIFVSVLGANALGLRVSARVQLVVAAVLTVMIALAVALALPHARAAHWRPFAPHGWWAVGTAGNILIWLFVGWESAAQLVGEFRDPRRQLPRAMAIAYATIAVLYCGLGAATIGVGTAHRSTVPLADLMAVGLGSAGRHATAVLAVALTMATMNVYLASAARLAASLSASGALPAWLEGNRELTVPRRPLLVIGGVGIVLLLGLALGAANATVLVRATSACFVAVYVAATAAAVKLLRGRTRLAAVPTAGLVAVIAVFSSWYLVVPVLSALAFIATGRRLALAAARRRGPERYACR